MAAKGKGLGKGLGSLLGDVADINRIVETKPITEEDLKSEQMIKIRLIEPNRNQPRKSFDEAALQELADSIRIHGVIQPLIVTKRGEHYQIIAGERRWRAAKIAGLRELPVIVKDYTDKEIDEISLIENIQRQDLNPIEEAAAFQRLMGEYELTQEELAERVAKSRTVITNSIRLLKLPESVQEMLRTSALSTGHAKVILGLDTAEKQEEAAKIIVNNNLSVRETEKLVKTLNTPKKEPKLPERDLKRDLAYEEAENHLKQLLKAQVHIKRKNGDSGKIEISYHSVEELERIISHVR